MSFYKENKKTINIVGGIAIGLLTLAFILPKRDTTGSAPTGKNDKGDPLDPSGNVFHPFDIAALLFEVMSGWGKNSATVLEILRDKVPYDGFGAVKTAFGKRKYNYFTGGQAGGSMRDLIYWIREETTKEHYLTIKAMFPTQNWI